MIQNLYENHKILFVSMKVGGDTFNEEYELRDFKRINKALKITRTTRTVWRRDRGGEAATCGEQGD